MNATPSDNSFTGPELQASIGALLADETRIRILEALYDVHADATDASGLPFSTLRRRVDVADSGRFNYHLSQLQDQLVEKENEQYVLTPIGTRLVRAFDQRDDQS